MIISFDPPPTLDYYMFYRTETVPGFSWGGALAFSYLGANEKIILGMSSLSYACLCLIICWLVSVGLYYT